MVTEPISTLLPQAEVFWEGSGTQTQRFVEDAHTIHILQCGAEETQSTSEL